MWEIWANKFLPMALNSCPKSNKSPYLVTLVTIDQFSCGVKHRAVTQSQQRANESTQKKDVVHTTTSCPRERLK